ncbi:MAG: barstar family protein [Solobacterium sp.]|nr:barstar family protein [Solobacterium sp.]MBQ6223303.1 barstar family protein [Solobacterium sp.]MBR2668270.1 barstar family protein [Solobacterium sp.]
MKKVIVIDPERIKERKPAHEYMHEIFSFESFYGRNLDALADALSEVHEEYELVFTPESITEICENAYAYKILMVLGQAANTNPYIHVVFKPSPKPKN